MASSDSRSADNQQPQQQPQQTQPTYQQQQQAQQQPQSQQPQSQQPQQQMVSKLKVEQQHCADFLEPTQYTTVPMETVVGGAYTGTSVPDTSMISPLQTTEVFKKNLSYV